MTAFTKMHGLGNDFLILDGEDGGSPSLTPALIRHLCDRRRGVGCDQLIILQKSRSPGIERFVQFYNADGSEASACGNGSRCIVGFLHEKTGRKVFDFQSNSGVLHGRYLGNNVAQVDMGKPVFSWREIPLSRNLDTLHLPVEGDPAAVSMGNPHATFFVEHFTQSLMGLMISELPPLFPRGVNTGFAHVLGRDRIRLKVHERGSGFTLACGTGACATVVNAIRREYVDRLCRVEMDGGEVYVHWDEKDGHVYMKGEYAFSFSGNVTLEGPGE